MSLTTATPFRGRPFPSTSYPRRAVGVGSRCRDGPSTLPGCHALLPPPPDPGLQQLGESSASCSHQLPFIPGAPSPSLPKGCCLFHHCHAPRPGKNVGGWKSRPSATVREAKRPELPPHTQSQALLRSLLCSCGVWTSGEAHPTHPGSLHVDGPMWQLSGGSVWRDRLSLALEQALVTAGF